MKPAQQQAHADQHPGDGKAHRDRPTIAVLVVATLMTMVVAFVFVVVMVATVIPVVVLIVRFAGVIVGGHKIRGYFSKNITNKPSKQSSPPSTPLS